MPLPKPRKGEEEDDFISRCMSETKEEYPDREQRLAVCYRQWREERDEMRSWYEIRDAKDGTVEVLLYDEIGGFGVTAKEFVDELRAIKSPNIDLRVNSPGGDVFDGIAIYNALKNHAATVTATVDGLAASSAAFIVQAANRVYMATGATMMIHEPFGMTIGDAAEHEKMADTLSKMGDTIAGIYALRAGGTEAEWRERMRAESWYRAQEAVDIKLADALLETRQARSYASVFNLSRFKNVPDWVPQACTDSIVNVAIAPHTTAKAPESENWEAPALADFTSERWEDLSDAEKRRIATHYVWTPKMPPDRFSDLKGGHHRPQKSGIGPVVWRAVSSGRMAQMPEYNDAGVWRHLARHYEQFGRTPPWEEEDKLEASPILEGIQEGVSAVVGKPKLPPHDFLETVKAATSHEGG